MLVKKVQIENPNLKKEEFIVVEDRLRRFLKINNWVTRRVTHVAQSTKPDQKELSDWVTFMNERLDRLNVENDVGVNRPFKAHFQECFDDFSQVNNKKPQRSDVARWVKEAWEEVTSETIMKAWDHIGINLK